MSRYIRCVRCVLGPLFAPMYERIARTGPSMFATNAPSPSANVLLLRPQLLMTNWFLCPSRISTPPPTCHAVSYQRSVNSMRYVAVVTDDVSGFGPVLRLYVAL